MSLTHLPETCWLLPEEHEDVVENLVRFGLIKMDNRRSLPLKKGGTTDIYINLRDARNNADATRFVSELYALALRRLDIHRFIEVPEAVSCFAGPISLETGLPYLTIREQAKEGRATDARVIGQGAFRDRVVIIDDVITDGASKIVPIRECRRLGFDLLGLVVLVDRQQGWEDHFTKNGIITGMWAGMTLHDVRRVLIERGYLERCDPVPESWNPLILALDGKSWNEYLPLIEVMRPTGCILKVNDMAFDEGVARLMPNLSVYGRVMLDLKLHDIPNTVGNICRRVARHPPWAVTVHASGGAEMIRAAKNALPDTNVLAVTVLTTFDERTCKEVYHRLPANQVEDLAKIAANSGADGFVCAPEEATMLHRRYPKLHIVTPGIRSANVERNDQKRVATPAEARAAGANYVVMGRQITEHHDPAAEARRVLIEELGLSQFISV